jgi:hypothetical protein
MALAPSGHRPESMCVRSRSSARGRAPIPLLICGNGPKGQRHATLHADTWSGDAEEWASVDKLGPRLASLDAMVSVVELVGAG